MATTRLSDGHIFIPDEVREAAHLQDGQWLVMYVFSARRTHALSA